MTALLPAVCIKVQYQESLRSQQVFEVWIAAWPTKCSPVCLSLRPGSSAFSTTTTPAIWGPNVRVSRAQCRRICSDECVRFGIIQKRLINLYHRTSTHARSFLRIHASTYSLRSLLRRYHDGSVIKTSLYAYGSQLWLFTLSGADPRALYKGLVMLSLHLARKAFGTDGITPS